MVSDINRVVDGGFCIGCGGCAVQNPAITIDCSLPTIPQARLSEGMGYDAVCPFASQTTEDDISDELYWSNPYHDGRIGRYIGTYAGHVNDEAIRMNSSSGGMASWVLLRLLERGEIDGVIHVGRGQDSGYEYLVSETVDGILGNSKSRYYPVHFEKAVSSILGNGKRYAFVGVPCFVKAIKLLSMHDVEVRKSIVFCISIFCGHMKTKLFSDMIAMQQGVDSENLRYVDFRVKNRGAPANNYCNQVYYDGEGGGTQVMPPMPTKKLHGMDWGLGYFKAPACDWCDDIAGETADFSCGDAWLPEYVADSLGTSVMITRNPIIEDILLEGHRVGDISLDPIQVDKIRQSQAGNYRHRQEGLSVRIADAEKEGRWVPSKRIGPQSFQVGRRRRAIYRHRQRLMRQSQRALLSVRNRNDYLIFMLKMLPYELYYAALNGNFLRGAARIFMHYAQYFRNNRGALSFARLFRTSRDIY